LPGRDHPLPRGRPGRRCGRGDGGGKRGTSVRTYLPFFGRGEVPELVSARTSGAGVQWLPLRLFLPLRSQGTTSREKPASTFARVCPSLRVSRAVLPVLWSASLSAVSSLPWSLGERT